MTATAKTQRLRLERLLVTRPAEEAERWSQALKDHHWPSQILPLIDIGEPRSPTTQQALVQARADWSQWDALMFVSGAAVTHFFAQDGLLAADTGSTRFWAPGPGTGAVLAQVLDRVGVSSNRIDAPPLDAKQFDSEALWPVVRAQVGPGKRVLVVRGETLGLTAKRYAPTTLAGHGRNWLIQECEALGASVQTCVAYERRPPLWDSGLRAQARAAAQAGCVWLFSSSESVFNLRTALPEVNWAQAAALTTHDRIAIAAREAGFGEVCTSRPALPDVLRALESHWSHP